MKNKILLLATVSLGIFALDMGTGTAGAQTNNPAEIGIAGIDTNALGITGPVVAALGSIPTVPLNQATVIVDVGTYSEPGALWNNVRADYLISSNWFLGGEFRNNITTIGYAGGQAGWAVAFSPTVQFSAGLQAGWSLADKCAQVAGEPLHLRYTPAGSPITLEVGLDYYWKITRQDLGVRKSGPGITGGICLPFGKYH